MVHQTDIKQSACRWENGRWIIQDIDTENVESLVRDIGRFVREAGKETGMGIRR